jgi:hypothetical protein
MVKKSVLIVDINVNLVQENMIPVTNVKVSELQLLIVTVQVDIMKLKT